MASNHNDHSNQFESVDLKDPPPSSNINELPSSPSRKSNNNNYDDNKDIQVIKPPSDKWQDDDDEAPMEDMDVKMPARSSGEKGGGMTADDLEASKDGIVKPKKKKKKKPEMNPKFKDVQETGRWGEISKKEIIIAITIFFLVIVGVVLAVLFLVVLPEEENAAIDTNATVSYVPAPTMAPTPPPTSLPPQEELALVLAALQDNPVTASLIQTGALFDDVAFYEGLTSSASATPQQKAMSWLLFQDDVNDPAESVGRFAFASIYFQNGGDEWTSSEGWLTSVDTCEWDHIECDARGFLQEIDLTEQNVSGNLALEFALLDDTLQSILISRNRMEGPIPAAVFSALPRLGLLYLDNNRLTGIIPAELVTDARLHTLYVQFNNFTGEWPLEFCDEGTSLLDFGLDCDQLACDPGCCTPLECYYAK